VPSSAPELEVQTTGNAELKLMDWLRRPVLLYHWVLRREGVACEGQAYEPRSADGSTAVRAGSSDELAVHDGALRGPFFDLRLHGYSRTSLLINGVEWFSDEATCRKTGLRRRPESLWLPSKAYRLPADITLQYCDRLSVKGFGRHSGHLTIWRAAASFDEAAEYDWSLFPVVGRIWLAPRGQATTSDRTAGMLQTIEPFAQGFRVGEQTWFNEERHCRAALKRLAAKPAR
jgi:hypothetical protein